MRCRVFHRTRYRYDRPVFLEPHRIRLIPRGDAAQRLLAHHLDIRPLPAGSALVTDLYGNTVLSVWFSDLVTELTIEAACEVETLRANPFDFLADGARSTLPLPLDAEETAVLGGPCLAPPRGAQDRVRALAAGLVGLGAATPGDFLWALTTWFGAHVRPLTRHEPGLWDPDTVLARGEGACRDLAVCALAACRAVGIPSRFVSGYQEGDPDREDGDLHAWIEAWLPGGGWRGYDPTHGLAVADRHVALAAAPDSAGTAPVVGSFRGDGAVAELEHAVRLSLS